MNVLHRYLRMTAAAAGLSCCHTLPDFASQTSDEAAGPGILIDAAAAEAEEEAKQTEAKSGERGELLGVFTTSGYCNCEKCSGGHSLTYSGTVPTPDHTISADLSRFPIGTQLWIDGTVYTVEDMGSSVKGDWIDIFYASHEDALDHGLRSQEVYAVIP